MSLIQFRRPRCVVTKEFTSQSGKYQVFFGNHWRAGHLCYDVGTINQQTGEIVSRHYCEWDFDHNQPAPQAKAEALACLHELEKGMRRKPESEEQDERAFKHPFRA